MGYKMDMRNETAKKKLLPEGWRKFEIVKCEEQTSKKGNQMFVFTFRDSETLQDDEVYAIATQGKRWFLKSILAACNVPAAEDGVYDWDIPDVLNKQVSGRIQHFDETWINREGETVNSKKHKIVEIGEEIPF